MLNETHQNNMATIKTIQQNNTKTIKKEKEKNPNMAEYKNKVKSHLQSSVSYHLVRTVKNG